MAKYISNGNALKEGDYLVSLTDTRHHRKKGDVLRICYSSTTIGYDYQIDKFGEVESLILLQETREATEEEIKQYETNIIKRKKQSINKIIYG